PELGTLTGIVRLKDVKRERFVGGNPRLESVFEFLSQSFRRSNQVRGSQSVSLISFHFDLFSFRFFLKEKNQFSKKKKKKKYFRGKIKQIRSENIKQ
ncbi:hypothetical protein LINPERHAP1_LOCUS15150, partial [Linum perenne]